MIDFEDDIKVIFNEYTEEIKKEVAEIAEETAKECAAELQQTSPGEHKAKGYAKGWKAKKNGETYVVCNTSKPQLTHLLENGHEVVNQSGHHGRAEAIKHIEPAESKYDEIFEEKVRNKL